jgi:hypothetical protein
MSILNRPADGLLSVLLALRRALIAYGGQPEEDLLELVAPPSVVTDGKPDMARKTLTRWKQLGFFSDVDGMIALSEPIARIDTDDLDGLRVAVLRLILAPENNAAVLGEDSDDGEGSKAADCTRALAWALIQDPYAFPSTYKSGEALQDKQGVKPRIFINDTRWNGFAEWAVFLGIAWFALQNLVPSPAFAVRKMLNDVFLDAGELPQTEFFVRLAGVLPIVDGGSYRKAVEAQMSRPWRKEIPNEVSPSLSAALLTLEAEGTLRLETRSDAPSRMLLGAAGRELRLISHVVRPGAA